MSNFINFENSFLEFKIMIKINNNPLSIHNKFNELNLLAEDIFSTIKKENILIWIKSEILSFYNTNFKTILCFNENFITSYSTDQIKFDLIDSFFNNHKINDLDLSEDLFMLFNFYKSENNFYKSLKIISTLIFYVKKTPTLKLLIENAIFNFYQEKIDDQSLILNISAYVNHKYTHLEKKDIKSKIPALRNVLDD